MYEVLLEQLQFVVRIVQPYYERHEDGTVNWRSADELSVSVERDISSTVA